MSKILISGQWLWKQYQEACAIALERLGNEVVRFGWAKYFFSVFPDRDPVIASAWARLQNKFITGPTVLRINRELLKTAADTKPDVIWLYNDTHIYPATILGLRRLLPGALIVQYTNDNPWGNNQPRHMWRHLKKSIPLFDINFCYRKSNMEDFRLAGSKDTRLLRSYFDSAETFPMDQNEMEPAFRSDVVFAGHFEDDWRLDLLSNIARQGIDLKLFGTGWDAAISALPEGHPLKRLLPIKPVRGIEYRKAICGAKISLSFLSKLNNDTYTRRSFEIPAMKSFMLSEYTDDLNSMFKEKVDAEYFRSADELLSKIEYYLKNESQRKEIALSGYERVKRDGHDVDSRMKQFLRDVNSVRH
ncbi:MAG TPA: glycosyltransferase [Candidatus Kryptonia bacterium]